MAAASESDEHEFQDSADWTWVLEEVCSECGFEAAQACCEEVSTMLRANVARWIEVLDDDPERLRARPRVDKWSPLEYAFHVRDVYELFDERLQLMLTEEGPHFDNWDQDVTAREKDYRSADPARISTELAQLGEVLATRFDSVADDQWERKGFRSDGAEFTVDTFSRYFIHDPIHHLWDVRHES